MTHGPLPREPRPPMFIVTPGPTLTAYINGIPVAEAILSPEAAQYLAIELLTAVRMTMRASDSLPNENLPFAEHIARREADGTRNHAAEDDQA